MRPQTRLRGSAPWLSAVCLVASTLACRPPHRESARELQPAAHAWAAEHGLALASESALAALVGDARVVGLGEAAHGSQDVFDARASITRRLVEGGWVKAIVLENDAWQTCRLDRYLRGESEDASVLKRDVIGLYQHRGAREFFEWLRAFNREATQPIRVYGMDVQTDAACRVEIPGCPGREELCAQAKTLRDDRSLPATSYWLRDELMATNVMRALDEVDSGMLLWVHSGHAAKSAPMLAWDVRKTAAPLGQHLMAKLGRDYASVNVTFVEGEVAAGNAGGRLFRFRPRRRVPTQDFTLAAAPKETLEGTLAAPEATVYPLATLPVGSNAAAWFSRPHFMRSIGSLLSGWRATRGSAYVGWDKAVPREAFDALVVLPGSQPIAFDFD